MNDEELTPEQQYESYSPLIADGDARIVIAALRDMIAALDHDLNVQNAALTTLDNRVSALAQESVTRTHELRERVDALDGGNGDALA